jgi:glutaryl-CoA dehydrogenase
MTGSTTAPAAVDPLDFLDVQRTLSDEERGIADTVRSLVADRILPEVGDWYERGEFPSRELAPELGRIGLLGMHLDGWGCAGTNAVSYGLACLELEAGDSGLRSFVSVQGSLAMFPIHVYGSDEQRETWLPRMAAGEVIGCFGLTEPDSGYDPASMRTRARRDGADWILDGRKMWITNAREGPPRRHRAASAVRNGMTAAAAPRAPDSVPSARSGPRPSPGPASLGAADGSWCPSPLGAARPA